MAMQTQQVSAWTPNERANAIKGLRDQRTFDYHRQQGPVTGMSPEASRLAAGPWADFFDHYAALPTMAANRGLEVGKISAFDGTGPTNTRTVQQSPLAASGVKGLRTSASPMVAPRVGGGVGGGGGVMEEMLRGLTRGRSGPGQLLALREAGLLPSAERMQAEDAAATQEARQDAMTPFQRVSEQSALTPITLGIRRRVDDYTRGADVEDSRAMSRIKSENYWQREEPIQIQQNRRKLELDDQTFQHDRELAQIEDESARAVATIRGLQAQGSAEARHLATQINAVQRDLSSARREGDRARTGMLEAQLADLLSRPLPAPGPTSVQGLTTPPGGGSAGNGGDDLSPSEQAFIQKALENGYSREDALATIRRRRAGA